MYGLASLLDAEHERLVEDLWAELKNGFGVRGIYQTPFVHFSYQIAESYDLAALEPLLRRLARSTAPFHIWTTGLGVFTGARPVLYIPVVRGPALDRFHRALWEAIAASGAAGGVADYYGPARWMPHITIGFGDINRDNLCSIMPALSERDFAWEIAIDNVVVGGEKGILLRVPLEGEG